MDNIVNYIKAVDGLLNKIVVNMAPRHIIQIALQGHVFCLVSELITQRGKRQEEIMDEAPALRAAITSHSGTDPLFASLTAPILPRGNFHEISTMYRCVYVT